MPYPKSLTSSRFARYFYFALVLGIVVVAIVGANTSGASQAAFQSQDQQRTEHPPKPGLPNYDVRLAGKSGFDDFDLTSFPGRERAKQNAHARARLAALDEFVNHARPDTAQNLRAIANETGAMKNFFIDGGALSEPNQTHPTTSPESS